MQRDTDIAALTGLERPRAEGRRHVPAVFAVAAAHPHQTEPGEIVEQGDREPGHRDDTRGAQSEVELGRGRRGRHELDRRPEERVA